MWDTSRVKAPKLKVPKLPCVCGVSPLSHPCDDHLKQAGCKKTRATVEEKHGGASFARVLGPQDWAPRVP